MGRQTLIWSAIAAMAITAILAVFFIRQRENEKTIKIGAVLSISSPAGPVTEGVAVRNGMLLAIDEINSLGGINGSKIELIIKDSKTKPQEGRDAFKEIEATQHPLLYASMWSSVSMALAPLAKQNEVVLVGLVASTPKLTKQNEWTYRYYITAKDEVPPILSLLQEFEVKELGILYSNEEWGISTFELFKKEFARTDGIVKGEAFEPDSTDFKEQIAKLKETGVIYAVGYPVNIVHILKQLKEENFGGFILAPSTVTLPFPRSIPEANGVYVAAPIIYNPNYLLAKEIKEEYETRYNEPFNHFAANGYDFVRLLASLVEDKEVSRRGVKTSLEEGFIYSGVFGNLDVKPGEHDIVYPLYPAQIVDGELKYLRFNAGS